MIPVEYQPDTLRQFAEKLVVDGKFDHYHVNRCFDMLSWYINRLSQTVKIGVWDTPVPMWMIGPLCHRLRTTKNRMRFEWPDEQTVWHCHDDLLTLAALVDEADGKWRIR